MWGFETKVKLSSGCLMDSLVDIEGAKKRIELCFEEAQKDV